MITNEMLAKDLCELRDKLGKIPSIRHYDLHGKYSSTTYKKYFGSWLKACVTIFGQTTHSSIQKEQNKCLLCGTDTFNPKFCSISCSSQYNAIHNKRAKKINLCPQCNSPIHRRSIRCQKCRMEESYDRIRHLTIEEYHNLPSVKEKHPSWKNGHIRIIARTWHKDLVKEGCRYCGYKLHVELCHIKSIASFPTTATIGEINNKNNIIPLCRNHHWEFDHGYLVLTADGKLIPLAGVEPASSNYAPIA
jgi:hypothetical protein